MCNQCDWKCEEQLSPTLHVIVLKIHVHCIQSSPYPAITSVSQSLSTEWTVTAFKVPRLQTAEQSKGCFVIFDHFFKVLCQASLIRSNYINCKLNCNVMQCFYDTWQTLTEYLSFMTSLRIKNIWLLKKYTFSQFIGTNLCIYFECKNIWSVSFNGLLL